MLRAPSGAGMLLLSFPLRAGFSSYCRPPIDFISSAQLPSQRELWALLDQGFEAARRRGIQYLLHASHWHVALVFGLSAQVYCFYHHKCQKPLLQPLRISVSLVSSFENFQSAFCGWSCELVVLVWFFVDVKLLCSVLLTLGGT
ncbi:unnamed protein product [Arabidopsis lyrata]|nr:unnamed protein product [Arabidopsis lyrata]